MINSYRSNVSDLMGGILLTGLLLIGVSCKKEVAEEEVFRGFTVDSAMVVSARHEASEIGVSILQKGGNAFDAMIATDLALTVSYPIAGNIGGGGFMVFPGQ